MGIHLMKYHFLFVIGLYFLFSCNGKGPAKYTDTKNKNGSDSTGSVKAKTAFRALDTTWFLFSDSSYRLNIHIFNPGVKSPNENNSVVSFYYVKAGKTKYIFQDSFYCTDDYIVRQDFNGDHVKDV